MNNIFWTPERVDKLKEMLENKISTKEIGKYFGKSEDCIRMVLSRKGVKRSNLGQNTSELTKKRRNREEDIANRIRKLKGESIEVEVPKKSFSDEELLRFVGKGFAPQKTGVLKRKIWNYVFQNNRRIKWDRNIARLVLGCDLFCKEIIGEKLQNYQLAMVYLMLKGKRTVFVMGRQIGKDFSISIFSIWAGITNSNYKQLIVSNSQRASDELFNRILSFIARSDELFNSVEESNKEKLMLKNNSVIYPLPATGQIRGFTQVDRAYCNEVAHGFPDDTVESVLEPMLAVKDGFMVLMSTPLGTEGILYESFNSPLHLKLQLPSECNKYIPKNFLEKRREMSSNIVFQTEYMAQFMDVQNIFINSKDTDRAVQDYDLHIIPEKGKTYYCGVDWGRVRDSSVIIVISEDDVKMLKVEYIREFMNTANTEVVAYVMYLHDKYHFRRIVSEWAGLGIEPTDQLKKKFGGIVIPFKPTADSKLQAYEFLKLKFENEEITIPKHRKLVTELKMLQFEVTPSGNVKIHHPEGGSDDHADALCLAVWGTKSRGGVYILNEDLVKRTNDIVFW